MTPVFELGVDDSGNPKEYMPGNAAGLNIAITRYDTYKDKMEDVFGSTDLAMLTRQSQPFDVIEKWSKPDTTDERYIYQGCWFTSLGRAIRSDDNRIVSVNATLVYTKKMKVTGSGKGIEAVNNFFNKVNKSIGIS